MERYQTRPKAHQDKGIPLCLPNNVSWDPATGIVKKTSGSPRSTLHAVPAAVEMLQQIKEPVCVVSIAGPCRDGKSYILGEIFGKMEIFPVGHMVDPETTGIWMWIVPQTFKDSRDREFKVILLDSEGINAVTAEGQNDNQIFTLTVLLASILIYNSKGVPKRTDLNDLDFIVKLSQRIRIRSNGSHDDKDKFRDTFPFFFWLLRDVSQKLPPDCRDFNQFFSTRVFKDSSTSEDQRKVAESILSFFSGFESFALPVPSEDDDIMQEISKHWNDLNPKFREGVKNFESLLKSKLVPKKSINQGEYVTGEALGALVQLYTEAINDPDAIPNVETAWDTYVRTKCAEARKGAFKIYDERMTQLSERLPCDNGEILKNHETAQRESMENFESETAELISKTIGKESKKLTKSIEEKLHFWKDKNATLTEELCQNLLGRLKTEHLDPVLERVGGPDGAKVNYGEIMNGWNKIKTEFNSKAVGAKDVRANVFFKYNQYLEGEVLKYKNILKKMKDYDENVSKEQVAKAFAEKERRRLEEALAEKGKQEKEWQRKMDMLEKRQEEELKLIKEQAKSSKEALEKQMQLMKEADMKAQGQLQKQLDAARENEKLAYKNLQDMKQLFEKSKNDAKADRAAADLTIKQMREDYAKAQAGLETQLSEIASRESQTNEHLNDMMKLWEEDRKKAAAMRGEIRSLNAQLVEANKPGFIRWLWGKIY